jgi:hypothetical protein
MQLMVDASASVQRQQSLQASVNASPRAVAQRLVQLQIDASTGGMAAIGGGMPATHGFTPLPNANIAFSRVVATTSPADPLGMAHWKALGFLDDPSRARKQALTRMHAIRGRFGGPSAPDNMFLGTAQSNNQNSQSHYSLVEKPLEDYVRGAKLNDRRLVNYTVTPITGNVPGYMQHRINAAPLAQQAGIRAFANAHIPNGFDCTADLYRQVGQQVLSKTSRQHVRTDVGAPAVAAVAPSNVVAKYELPLAGSLLAGLGVGAYSALSGMALPWMAAGAAGAITAGALHYGYKYLTSDH